MTENIVMTQSEQSTLTATGQKLGVRAPRHDVKGDKVAKNLAPYRTGKRPRKQNREKYTKTTENRILLVFLMYVRPISRVVAFSYPVGAKSFPKQKHKKRKSGKNPVCKNFPQSLFSRKTDPRATCTDPASPSRKIETPAKFDTLISATDRPVFLG